MAVVLTYLLFRTNTYFSFCHFSQVPQDFHGQIWNVTSKLWHTWSLLSYITNDVPATCTPETNKGGQIIKGAKAEYNAASGIKGNIYWKKLRFASLA